MNNRLATTFALAAVMTLATATPTLARRHATTTGIAATYTTVVVTVAIPGKPDAFVPCHEIVVIASQGSLPPTFSQPFGRTNSPCRGRFIAPLGQHRFSIPEATTDRHSGHRTVAADAIQATIVQGGNAELDFVYQ